MNRHPLTTDRSCCNLCGSLAAHYLYKELGIIECDACGLVRVDAIPGREQLRRLYSENYFRSTDSGTLGYDDYIADRKKISKTFQKRMSEIERCIGRKGRLLDVGCAAGFSLEVARERGWDAHGIEISEFACNFARSTLGLNVSCGSLQEADLAPKTFDVVTMWDYIEHCPDPARELTLANQLMKTRGLLALSTPDICSLPARTWGANWMGIKQGEHLFYFSPETITRLLRQSGFEVIRLKHVGKYVDVAFFIKRTGLYSSAIERLLGHAARLLRVADRVLYVNPFDIMLVYGRKINDIE